MSVWVLVGVCVGVCVLCEWGWVGAGICKWVDGQMWGWCGCGYVRPRVHVCMIWNISNKQQKQDYKKKLA